MSAELLALRGVHTRVGSYHILQGVDFAVAPGSLTMLLGRNGAGKTTCLRTIMGLWRASAGRIRYDGAELQKLETPAIAQLGIAYVPENMGIFADLTVMENLDVGRQAPRRFADGQAAPVSPWRRAMDACTERRQQP